MIKFLPFLVLLVASTTITLPMGGNAWFNLNGFIQSDSGANFNALPSSLTAYIYFKKKLNINLKIKFNNDVPIKITATIGENHFESELQEVSSNQRTIDLGSFVTYEDGYNRIYIDITGDEENQEGTGIISQLIIETDEEDVGYTLYGKDPSNFYWYRRGESPYLWYNPPEQTGDIQYFYNQITVPEDYDNIGLYAVAAGFSEGYFGIQVNSEDERRILFSIWSAFDTNNPDEIPADFKVTLNKKGENVNHNDFGNEGSGGQSYLIYNWKAENTYRFLIRTEPNNQLGYTDCTAWFQDVSNSNNWNLIASWRKPKVARYISGLYSFLENFMTENGNQQKKAIFTNQWVYDGEWKELVQASVTPVTTDPVKQDRRDFNGGLIEDDNAFFLQTNGFFNETIPLDNLPTVNRNNVGNTPDIDFESLP